ncbi:hypothetical protein PI125_g17841 [Phytophthora idaei]|nr:hypothetical protein PI125_g17841 [Phytophthora idaei]
MQQSSTDTGTTRPRIRRRTQSPRPHPEIPAIQRLATSSRHPAPHGAGNLLEPAGSLIDAASQDEDAAAEGVARHCRLQSRDPLDT